MKYIKRILSIIICFSISLQFCFTYTPKVRAQEIKVPEVTLDSDDIINSIIYFGNGNAWSNTYDSDNKQYSLINQSSYNDDDEGESFFSNNLSEEEQSIVTENSLKASKIVDNSYQFGLSIDASKIGYSILSDKLNPNEFNKVNSDSTDKNHVLALIMSNKNLDIKLDNDTYSKESEISITHKSAKSVYEDATQLSAMILNKDNDVLYYGKLNDINATASTINLPSDLSIGNYKLLVFAHKTSDDKNSEYISKLNEAEFKIVNDSNDVIDDEDECNIENCSHIYADLKGELHALCDYGKLMLEYLDSDISLYADDSLTDSLANKPIYFASIPNLYNDNKHLNSGSYKQSSVTKVNAIFSSENNTITYLMKNIQDGYYSTIIPDASNNSDDEKYYKIKFQVFYEDGSSKETIEYNFRADNDQDDKVSNNAGSFTYTKDKRDCYYFYNDNNSYWSGHSVNDQELAGDILYVDNDSDGDYDGGNLSLSGDIYVSYYDANSNKFVSEKVDGQTSEANVFYYRFPSSSLTETSLIAISNGELIDGGTFKDGSDGKIFYITYNLSSGDNTVVLRNLDDLDSRIVSTHNSLNKKIIAFRDQIYGGSGALVQGDANAKATGTVQYRFLSSSSEDNSVSWKNMTQHTSDNDDIFAGTDQYKLFFVYEDNSKWVDTEENKYIQFRIKNSTGTQTYKTEVQEIPGGYDTLCFFGDVYQYYNSASVNTDTNAMHGYWTEIDGINYSGDEVGDSNTEVPVSDSDYNSEYFYADSTFINYYSDIELHGKKIEDSTSSDYVYSGSGYHVNCSILNTALSNYFENKDTDSKSYPLYYGQRGQNVYAQYNGSKQSDNGTYNQYRYSSNASGDYRTSYNTWIEGLKYAYSYIDKSLNSDGLMTTNNIPYIQWDEDFIRGNNEYKTALGQVYNNVSFPFKKNSNGYWEFDSSKSEYSARLKQDSDGNYYVALSNNGVMNYGSAMNSQNGFYPFTDPSIYSGVTDSDQRQRITDYLFGMKLNLNFSITEDGQITTSDGSKTPIQFEFSGDDDFELYIDDKLVIDLTGIHDAIDGTINFKTGEVTITNTYANSSYEIVKGSTTTTNGQQNIYNTGMFTKEDLSSSKHKITIFYSERGMGGSNLKMLFNFPTSNTLSVTNSVDTSGANSIFEESLKNIGSFKYVIQNQVTSGDTKDVKDSTGYLQKIDAVDFKNITNATSKNENLVKVSSSNGVLSVNNQKSSDDSAYSYSDMVEKIKAGYYWVQVDNDSAVDLSQMEYLAVNIYNKSKYASQDGSVLYVKLIDSSGGELIASLNELGYSSFTNAMPLNKWSLLKIGLDNLNSKANNFDMNNVVSIAFAYAEDGASYDLKDLYFSGKTIDQEKIGFGVSDSEISDYTSINNGSLQNITGAWGELSSVSNDDGDEALNVEIDSDGSFGLFDNEKMSFNDKFRKGSYLKIEQDDVKNSIFDTTWTIKENNNNIDDLTASNLKTTKYELNDDGYIGLTDQKGTNSSDSRYVLSSGDIVYPTNSDGSSSKGETILFSSYSDPDNLKKDNLNLTVEYTNVLKTGGIIITKKVEKAATEDTTYKFKIVYTNIAGLNLELATSSETQAGITQYVEVTIKKGNTTGSIAVNGIPLNTEYTISEVNEKPNNISAGIKYKNTIDSEKEYTSVNLDNLTESGTFEDNTTTYESKGTIDSSLQQSIFSDDVNDTYGEVKITKKLPESVYINDHDFEFHIDYTKDGTNYTIPIIVTMNAGELSASYVYSNMPLYDSSGNKITYYVHEVNDDDFESISAGNCYKLGSDSEIETVNKHTNIQVLESSDNTFKNICRDNYDSGDNKVIKATANASRQEFIITNRGPFSIAVLKTDNDDNTVIDANFALYKCTNNHTSSSEDVDDCINADNLIKTKKTSYYFKHTVDTSSSNYDSTHCIYRDGDNVYYVYDVDGVKYYYVPLTSSEVNSYEHDTMDESKASDVVTVVLFTELEYGTYHVKEVNPPNGYSLSDDYKISTFEFTNIGEGATINDLVKVINIASTGSFIFYKQNTAGNYLSGAKFAVYEYTGSGNSSDTTISYNSRTYKSNTRNWSLVTTVTSDNTSGLVKFTNLSTSKEYRLVEVVTPDGYIEPDGQWKVKFSKGKFRIFGSIGSPPAAKEDNNNLIVLNYTYKDLPVTGSIVKHFVIGLILIFSAISLYYIKEKREENEKDI